jgi:hypothetical protein
MLTTVPERDFDSPKKKFESGRGNSDLVSMKEHL